MSATIFNVQQPSDIKKVSDDGWDSWTTTEKVGSVFGIILGGIAIFGFIGFSAYALKDAAWILALL